jgi:EpsI family protein
MKMQKSGAFFATAMLLLSCLALNAWTSRRVPERLVLPLTQISSRIGDWTASRDQPLDESTLGTLHPSAYLVRTYQKNGANLNLFIAYYAQQHAGESMHSPKHCLPGAGWEIWREHTASVQVDGKDVAINQDSVENLDQRLLMFYWYQSKTRVVASEYLGKILLARDCVLGGRTAGSIVRITLPDTPGMAEQGAAFAAALIPEVQRCVGQKASSGSD